MTIDQIKTKAASEMLKYEIAQQIRSILDAGADKYEGDDAWEDVEAEIIEMVTADA